MLLQNSLPILIGSNCAESWGQSPKCDECREVVICSAEEESKLSSKSVMEHSRSYTELSAAGNICCAISPTNSCIYKRRKLQGNTVGYINYPFTVLNEDMDKGPSPTTISSNTQDNGSGISSQNDEEGTINPDSAKKKLPPDNNSITDNQVRELSHCEESGSSEKASDDVHVSSTLINERHSSDTIAKELLEDSISTKELCTLVLKHHGLLEGGVSATGGSQQVLHISSSRPCKICVRLEDLVKMLICDLCEASFHVSCCNPRIKKLPVDNEWICHPCFKKRPKSIGKKNSKEPVDVSETSRRWKRSNLGPILYMLRTNELYTSGVRIGKDFQAKVLPWSGPLYDDCNYFGQSMELDPAERASRNDSNDITPSNSSSVGNWLQCRNVIYKDADESDEGTVCGKWRRAPLFAIQTDDWDCSCAVVWDPIHADCAVPQELETDMVLKNLKYVEMLNRKLAHKQSKFVETGSGGGPE